MIVSMWGYKYKDERTQSRLTIQLYNRSDVAPDLPHGKMTHSPESLCTVHSTQGSRKTEVGLRQILEMLHISLKFRRCYLVDVRSAVQSGQQVEIEEYQ